MLQRVLLFVLVSAVCAQFSFRPPSFWKRKLYEQRMDEKHRDATEDPYPWVNTSWFSQKMDHFDSYNTNTWQQKYYTNTTYYRGNSIIFLMIGGEGPESKHWAGDPDVQYLQWAAEYGALVFDLEHRFFGDSWPIPNMNVDSLRLLTSQQALADLAYFIQSMNQLYGFDNPRWVTFGGSYPGALAAWFRSKYPELTVGSVASGAVVNLKLDFYEYSLGVQDDLVVTKPDCADATRQAFQLIQNMTITKSGRDKLSAPLQLIFSILQPPFDENTTKLDITNLFGNLYNVYQGMSQYTYDGQSVKTETVETDQVVCDIMTNKNGTTPDLVDRVYELMIWYDEIYGDNSGNFSNSYTDAINSVKSGNLSDLTNGNDAARGWMWLCCNELGFLQTTDGGSDVFGSTIPLNFFIDMCTDMFDNSITMDHVYDKNTKAQKYYGGADKYYATNIVLPNGSMDPWHLLGSYFHNDTIGATSILINGTAHCSDMYPSYVGEPAGLVPARATIKAQVQQFIRYDPASDGPSGSGAGFTLFFAFVATILIN